MPHQGGLDPDIIVPGLGGGGIFDGDGSLADLFTAIYDLFLTVWQSSYRFITVMKEFVVKFSTQILPKLEPAIAQTIEDATDLVTGLLSFLTEATGFFSSVWANIQNFFGGG